MNPTEKGLYRSHKGIFMGVCRGIAEAREIPVFWIRLAFVCFFAFGGLPALAVYLLLVVFMKPEPSKTIESLDEKHFYDSYMQSRSLAIKGLHKKWKYLERKTSQVESFIVSKEYDWQQRLEKDL